LTHQRLALAERLGDLPIVMQCYENLGTLAFWRGDFEGALPLLGEALQRYDPERGRQIALVYGTDSAVGGGAYGGWALWFLGRPDQALRRCEEAVAQARQLGHANSLGLALGFLAAIHRLRRDIPATRACAEEAVRFCTEQQLPMWLGLAISLQGWALA